METGHWHVELSHPLSYIGASNHRHARFISLLHPNVGEGLHLQESPTLSAIYVFKPMESWAFLFSWIMGIQFGIHNDRCATCFLVSNVEI